MLKKLSSLILTIFLVLSVTFSLGVCLYGVSVTPAAETKKLTVVLDAGHGGIDGGVCGVKTKTPESIINLAIVKKLQVCFESGGFACVLTRKTDAGLYGAATPGFKKRDMQKRKQIIQEAKPVAVISVHQNAYPGSSRRGGQVFFKQESEEGHLLALAIQKQLNAVDPTLKGRDALIGDYFMLNCTDYASVIVECGFLSNAQDEKLLLMDEYQQVTATAIYIGAIAYLSAS